MVELTQFYEEVDRLALWGVNLPLAFGGQEYTWDRFWRRSVRGVERGCVHYHGLVGCVQSMG